MSQFIWFIRNSRSRFHCTVYFHQISRVPGSTLKITYRSNPDMIQWYNFTEMWYNATGRLSPDLILEHDNDFSIDFNAKDAFTARLQHILNGLNIKGLPCATPQVNLNIVQFETNLELSHWFKFSAGSDKELVPNRRRADIIKWCQWPLSLTWFNFKLSMDK